MTAETRFRIEARRWLDDNATRRTGDGDWSNAPVHDDPDAERAHLERCRAWQRTLYDGGWLLGWPEAFGGRAAEGWQRRAFAEETAAYDVTSGFITSGLALVGPVLLEYGTDTQKDALLPSLLRGDEVWCQLFSEPGAGSDLASLTTAAVRDGDRYVVTGQKVWTSAAHLADRAILLARTDPSAPKRRGITMFLLDMRRPGVDPRPLRTITGAAHFNEVFLTDVEVPAAAVLGSVDDGWRIARTVLANESAMIGSAADRADRFTDLLALARNAGRSDDPTVRQNLARCWTAEVLLDRLTGRVRADVSAGRAPSINGSVLKVLWSEGRRDRSDLAMHLLGPTGTARIGEDARDSVLDLWPSEFLNRFWGSIGGGTDEIHRNHIAERVLGLPR